MRLRLLWVSVLAFASVTAAAGCGSDRDADGFPAADTPSSTTARTSGAPASEPSVDDAAASASRRLVLRPVGRFTAPLFATGAPGDTKRLFVVEQAGRIRIVRGGRIQKTPFLDIRKLVKAGGEQGLLSVAFPPDYAKRGRFYVYYTDRQAKQRVVEYRRATAARANTSSARLVLRMDDPEANHNGGQLRFGPDGLMYIGTGDGGGAGDAHGARGNAQDLGSLLGKLLRIDPRASGSRPYRIPSSNPFVGREGARGEIYSYGLRNPWRFAFDRSTGALTIADVGQSEIEEVDHVAKGKGRGANFGWRPFEGNRRYKDGESARGAVAPVLELDHSDGYCSITGGYVVRDKTLPTSLRGDYVYGDLCEGHIRAAKLSPGGAVDDRQLPLKKVSTLASFGQDTLGRIYVVSLEGPVYRLTTG